MTPTAIQFERCTPEAGGLPSEAVSAFLDGVEAEGLELHSFMVLRHGRVLAEGWWKPYSREAIHLLYSLSKSFTSTAIGIAVDEGRLSIDDSVTSFFPNDLPTEIPKNLAAMRVRHLLSMSTGQSEDSAPTDLNWVRSFLSRPVPNEPGATFMYNSTATYMLSAIVKAVTGMDLLDYLGPRLFDPLGIEERTWERCPRGLSVGGTGLRISTESVARFGQLYLQRGVWNGQRLISESWIADATRSHVANGDDPTSDWNQGYGFQFWRCLNNAYRGDGAFGQFCLVSPEADLVVAITAGEERMAQVLDLVWAHLFDPLLASAIPEDPTQRSALQARMANLVLSGPAGSADSTTGSRVNGHLYESITQESQLQSFRLDLDDDSVSLTVADDRGVHVLRVGAVDWLAGTSDLEAGEPVAVACLGSWTEPHVFTAKIHVANAPASALLTCRFDGDRVSLQMVTKCRFGLPDLPAFEGRAIPPHNLT